jgi:hypothetical protein
MTQVQYAEFINEIFRRIGDEFGIRWNAPENPNHQLKRGDWSKEIKTGYVVEVRRKGYEPQEIGGLARNGLDPKSAEDIERELRNVLGRLVDLWEPTYWSLRFPINRRRIETAVGVWQSQLEGRAILSPSNDLALFDISFAQTGSNKSKKLQLFIPLADLSDDPKRNLDQLWDPIITFLESKLDSARVIFLNGKLERRD